MDEVVEVVLDNCMYNLSISLNFFVAEQHKINQYIKSGQYPLCVSSDVHNSQY